jgi:hypothetical protein
MAIAEQPGEPPIRQIIYDFFLCIENARIAFHLLLEGGDFHDTCIVVCLVSDLRAYSFLAEQYPEATDAHIADRLALQISAPKKHSYEELESYLHHSYYNAMLRADQIYNDYYPDRTGAEIVGWLAKHCQPPKWRWRR